MLVPHRVRARRAAQDVTPLPEPDADARAHSMRVTSAIRAEIVSNGGYIPFPRYMDRALHAPGLGYYAAGATKLGSAGDFVTAPEMTPLFGAALATQLAAILAVTKRREIVELGGGSGRLAADLLNALAARGKTILYISHILELVEKVCAHVVVIYQGRIVADDSVVRLRELMELPNLEQIFTQLVEQRDMEARANEIAAAIRA